MQVAKRSEPAYASHPLKPASAHQSASPSGHLSMADRLGRPRTRVRHAASQQLTERSHLCTYRKTGRCGSQAHHQPFDTHIDQYWRTFSIEHGVSECRQQQGTQCFIERQQACRVCPRHQAVATGLLVQLNHNQRLTTLLVRTCTSRQSAQSGRHTYTARYRNPVATTDRPPTQHQTAARD